MSSVCGKALIVTLLVGWLEGVSAPHVRAADTFEPAVLLDAPGLLSPANEDGTEGWALVCVTVKEDGSTAAPWVLDASPNDAFARAGLDAARKWRFQAARFAGESVESHRVCELQFFAANSPAARGSSIEELDAIEKMIEAQDLESASMRIDQLAQRGPLSLREGTRMHFLSHRLAVAREDPQEARAAIDRATVGGGRLLSAQELIPGLSARFASLVQVGHYREALELFARFESTPGGALPMVQLGKTAARIREVATAPTALAIQGRLAPAPATGDGVWCHRPLRAEVGLQEVDGSLEALVLHCDRRRERIAYQADVSWKVPASWGGCLLCLGGEPGTTFELIEYGASVEASPEATAPASGESAPAASGESAPAASAEQAPEG